MPDQPLHKDQEQDTSVDNLEMCNPTSHLHSSTDAIDSNADTEHDTSELPFSRSSPSIWLKQGSSNQAPEGSSRQEVRLEELAHQHPPLFYKTEHSQQKEATVKIDNFADHIVETEEDLEQLNKDYTATSKVVDSPSNSKSTNLSANM